MIADVHAKMALWRHIGNNKEQVTIQQVSQAIPLLRTNYGGKPVNIASNLRKRLKHHITQERILRYWIDHGKEFLGHEEFDKETFIHAGRNIQLQYQIWILKWSCGICGVGKWLECWKEQTHSKCPRCLTANETVDHVIHCQHNNATLCWDQDIEEIKNGCIHTTQYYV